MSGPLVLVVDDDPDIAELVKEILEERGLQVSTLTPAAPAALQEAVVRLEPGCVLLDGAGRGDYGQSWRDAAWLHTQARSIPVIMFSADVRALHEAQVGESARSQAAAFAAILWKPFAVDELVAVVQQHLRRVQHVPAA